MKKVFLRKGGVDNSRGMLQSKAGEEQRQREEQKQWWNKEDKFGWGYSGKRTGMKKDSIVFRFKSDKTNEKKSPSMKSLTQVRANNVWKLPSYWNTYPPTWNYEKCEADSRETWSLFFILLGRTRVRTVEIRIIWNKSPHSFYLASCQCLQLLSEEVRAISKHENTNLLFKYDLFCVLLQWFGRTVQINLQDRGHDILETSEKLHKNNLYKCKW